MSANGIGDAQAGTEVVRILNTVEYQKEGGFFKGIQHIIERDMTRLAGNPGHRTLMTRAATGHAGKAFCIDRNNPDRVQFGMAHQITHSGIMTFGVDEDFKNGVGLITQLGDDGVKAVDEAGL